MPRYVIPLFLALLTTQDTSQVRQCVHVLSVCFSAIIICYLLKTILTRNWYPSWRSKVESNTQAVATPVQNIRRQWPLGSGYNIAVNDVSLSTLALFIAILHHRLQWSFDTMETSFHIHKDWGDIRPPNLSRSTWWFWKLCIQSWYLFLLILTSFCLYVNYFRAENFVSDNQSRVSSLEERIVPLSLAISCLCLGAGPHKIFPSFTLACLLILLKSYTHKQQKWSQ